MTQPGDIVPGNAITPTPQASGTVPVIPSDVFTQFIAIQSKQNEIREKEVEIQKFNAETERTKITNAHDYSLKSLEAQINDRKDERKSESGVTRFSFWISLVIIIGFLAIIGFALFENKEQFITEVVRLLVVGGGGGGIGYAIGIRKDKPSAPNQSAP